MNDYLNQNIGFLKAHPGWMCDNFAGVAVWVRDFGLFRISIHPDYSMENGFSGKFVYRVQPLAQKESIISPPFEGAVNTLQKAEMYAKEYLVTAIQKAVALLATF